MIAKELRVGNWVQIRPGRYVDIDLRILSFIEESGYISAGYHPIPLTEEILLKCGFQKANTTNLYGFIANGYRYCVDIDKCEIHLDYMEYTSLYINIKYLHQLQNLYFALTGEELEVNL